MRAITLCVGLVLAVFSTTVMSYISLAAPIGPWIAPTLVLCALLMMKTFWRKPNNEMLLMAVATGSVGGILATACAFSFPTFYFLAPDKFNELLAVPVAFWFVMFLLSLAAGSYGFMIANFLEEKYLVEQKLAFPIGQLIYKMLVSIQSQARKAYELIVGFVGTAFFCGMQSKQLGIIPRFFNIVSGAHIGCFEIPAIRFDLQPLLWAIGFVTGHVIAIPLAVGAIARILLINPCNQLFFADISSMEFIFAFCSGMILVGTVLSFARLPKSFSFSPGAFAFTFSRKRWLELLVVGFLLFWFGIEFGFPLPVGIFLLVGAAMCTYQMTLIASKIGIAQLGAFATFVMVPAMLLFDLPFVHIVLIATFVQICGGVAVDLLFSRKAAYLMQANLNQLRWHQAAGLLASCCCVGVVFWLLITRFGLGSPELFAYKAQARHLLINLKRFDVRVLCIGGLFGLALKRIKVTPSLVLGGILMPIHLSLGLVVGGLPALWLKRREDFYPFWSGVYAANSLWMLLQAIL